MPDLRSVKISSAGASKKAEEIDRARRTDFESPSRAEYNPSKDAQRQPRDLPSTEPPSMDHPSNDPSIERPAIELPVRISQPLFDRSNAISTDSSEVVPFADMRVTFAVDASSETTEEVERAMKKAIKRVSKGLSIFRQQTARILPWYNRGERALELDELEDRWIGLWTQRTDPTVFFSSGSFRWILMSSNLWLLFTNGKIDDHGVRRFADEIRMAELHGTACIVTFFRPHLERPDMCDITVGKPVFALSANCLLLHHDLDTGRVHILQAKGCFRNSLPKDKNRLFMNRSPTWDDLPTFEYSQLHTMKIPRPRRVEGHSIVLSNGELLNLNEIYNNTLDQDAVQRLFACYEDLDSLILTANTRQREAYVQNWIKKQRVLFQHPSHVNRLDETGTGLNILLAVLETLRELKKGDQDEETLSKAQILKGTLRRYHRRCWDLFRFVNDIEYQQHSEREDFLDMLEASRFTAALSSPDSCTPVSSFAGTDPVETISAELETSSSQSSRLSSSSHILFLEGYRGVSRYNLVPTATKELNGVYGTCGLCEESDVILCLLFKAPPETTNTPNFPPVGALSDYTYPLALGNTPETDIIVPIICCDACSSLLVQYRRIGGENQITAALPLISSSNGPNASTWLSRLSEAFQYRFNERIVLLVLLSALCTVIENFQASNFPQNGNILAGFKKACIFLSRFCFSDPSTTYGTALDSNSKLLGIGLSKADDLQLLSEKSLSEVRMKNSPFLFYPLSGFIALAQIFRICAPWNDDICGFIWLRLLYHFTEKHFDLVATVGRPKATEMLMEIVLSPGTEKGKSTITNHALSHLAKKSISIADLEGTYLLSSVELASFVRLDHYFSRVHSKSTLAISAYLKLLIESVSSFEKPTEFFETMRGRDNPRIRECFIDWTRVSKRDVMRGHILLSEKVRLWPAQKSDTSGDILTLSPDFIKKWVKVDHEAERYLPLLYKSPIDPLDVCTWLFTALDRQNTLTPVASCYEAIESAISIFLESNRLPSGEHSPRVHRVLFEVDWSPAEFVRSQGYKTEPGQAIETAITISGSIRNAQATSCSQYLRQTWPDSGVHVLQLVKALARSALDGDRHLCQLHDKASVKAWIDEQKSFFEVSGIEASIARLGHQLSWLGATLRASDDRLPMYCVPRFSIETIPYSFLGKSKGDQEAIVRIHVSFHFQRMEELLEPPNGTCWYRIFGNISVARGSPILRRKEQDTGLEMPLNMMAGLLQTQHVNTFRGVPYLKGFSDMLVPIKHDEDTVFWHLLSNRHGQRISYWDNSIPCVTDILFDQLQDSRHILGWCNEVRYCAGSPSARYSLDIFNFDEVGPQSLLKRVSFRAGRAIRVGYPYSIGSQDTTYSASRNCYAEKILSLQQRYFVMWDDRDKRGWLVNSTSALLHLLRAYIEYLTPGTLGSHFLFQEERFQEATKTHKFDSAKEVLLNESNMNLEMIQGGEDPVCVKHKVIQFYEVLEKLIDQQIYMMDHPRSDATPRKELEGWNFMNIVKNKDPLLPSGAKIESMGKGWIDFTRSIYAVTLLGYGFGELFQMDRPSDCGIWNSLPPKMYYLAACTSDLAEIADIGTSQVSDPVRIRNGIIWHSPESSFADRQCRKSTRVGHCASPVQILLPSSLSSLSPSRGLVSFETGRCVIFGYNEHCSWIWGDFGNPRPQSTQSQKKAQLVSESDNTSFRLPRSTTDHGQTARAPHVVEDTSFTNFNNQGRLPLDDSGTSGAEISSECSDSSSPIPVTNRARSESPVTSSEGMERELEQSDRNGDIDGYFPHHYTVGIVCALSKELMAVRMLFDTTHTRLQTPSEDDNFYVFGRIGKYNVVAACLPSGTYGNSSAAEVMVHMKRTFTAIKFSLLVGIGGAVISKENDIRLGNVVVSHSVGERPAVIEHDVGKHLENGCFEPTGSVNRPPKVLRSAISGLTSDPYLPAAPLQKYLAKIESIKSEYGRPGPEQDPLSKEEDTHSERKLGHPKIHYGPIASGNQVIKDSKIRDSLWEKHKVLCVEMEAAGINTADSCLVIRGICDYADARKDKKWQEYASAVAAAYAKLLLVSMST